MNIKQCINKFFSGAFDIFVRNVVNYSTVTLAVMMAVVAITGWAPNEFVRVTANVLFFLMALSMTGYLIQDLVIHGQLIAFIGRTAAKVDSTRKEIENPSKYKAFFMAEALSKDEAGIKYLERINIVSAYDTLIFAARNFGYALLPVLFSLGLNLESFGVTWWPLVLLWKVSLPVFMVRYLVVLAVTLAATGLSEKYNEVLDFYHGSEKKES